MASRYLKCSCTDYGCGTIWRMARKHLDRAVERGGPWCPVCKQRGVEGDFRGLNKEERRAEIRRMQAEADEALEAHNAEMAKRMEAIRARRRVHAVLRHGVYTD